MRGCFRLLACIHIGKFTHLRIRLPIGAEEDQNKVNDCDGIHGNAPEDKVGSVARREPDLAKFQEI